MTQTTSTAGVASLEVADGVHSVGQILRQTPPAAQKVMRALVAAQAQHALFEPEQQVIVAVSGGADSVCLLHALCQLAPIWRLSLHVAHLDHALRPDSASDARFVAALAQELALPLHSARLEAAILEDVTGGMEVAARSARYAFLRQVANELSKKGNPNSHPATVATAHHQDDQAETLLLHLIQGSGLTGLAGMAWVGLLPDKTQPPIRLVRPLLGVSRDDIKAYLQSYALAWREDSTNLDTAHTRNKVRHEVLPLLATINPNIHATLARSADLLAAEAEHANARDRAALDAVKVQHKPSTRIVLDLFHLAKVDLATQRGVLRHALLMLEIDLRTVGMEGIETLLDQARAPRPSGPHPLVAGWAWTILCNGDRCYLSLHRAEALPNEVAHPHLGAPLATPLPIPLHGTIRQGALTHNNWQLQSSLITRDNLHASWRDRDQRWRFFGDAEECGDLYLNTFQPGMTIAPLGMAGHRRALGDIFTDHKIAPYLRPGWPVVVNGEGLVVWLCGLVVAETVRVRPDTSQIRHLLWQRLKTELETETGP
jgi:tRNA(Ile)-lysidine synthase